MAALSGGAQRQQQQQQQQQQHRLAAREEGRAGLEDAAAAAAAFTGQRLAFLAERVADAQARTDTTRGLVGALSGAAAAAAAPRGRPCPAFAQGSVLGRLLARGQ